MGNSFASRVAASLLKAIELPELITSTPQAYEALAIEIAKNPAKLAALKQKLASNRLTTPLFDTPNLQKILSGHMFRYMNGIRLVYPQNIYLYSQKSILLIDTIVSIFLYQFHWVNIQ
jgi:hypothetical protein